MLDHPEQTATDGATRRQMLAGIGVTTMAMIYPAGPANALTTAEKPGISRYAGLALNNSDLEAARKFYRDGLGLKEYIVLAAPPGTGITTPLEVVMTRSGDADEGGVLTLVDTPLMHKVFPMPTGGEGRPEFGRLTSGTFDLPALLERMKAAGYEIQNFGQAALGVDPDGYGVEVALATPEFLGAIRDGGKALMQTSSNAAPSLISRFVGIALNVSDLSRSLRYYTKGLGLAEMMRLPPKPGAGKAARIVLSVDGKLDGGVLVLVEASKNTGQGRTDFGHILCQTPDPMGAVKRLTASGFAQPATTARDSHAAVQYVKDPAGYSVALFKELKSL